MNSEDIKLVTELIEKKDSDQLKEVIKDLHPADIAELCNELDAEDARFIYLLLGCIFVISDFICFPEYRVESVP